jgi:hypothetical protein
MKLTNRHVEMTCNLVLSEREIQMLGWLAGYGAKQIAEAITKDLTSKFSKEEWEALWSTFRCELERTAEHFRNVRSVFCGEKMAADYPKPDVVPRGTSGS